MQFFVSTSYEKGLKLWFYCDQKQEIVKYPVFDKTHTSYLITSDDGRAELKDDDPRILGIEKVIKYDALEHRDVDLWKVKVRNPSDVWNDKTKSGLRSELTYSREDAVRYNLRYPWDTGLYFGVPYEIKEIEGEYSVKPILADPLKVKFKRPLKQLFADIFSSTISAPLLDPRRIALDIEVYQIPQKDGKKSIYLQPGEAKHPVMSISLKAKDRREVYAFIAEDDWYEHLETDPKDRENEFELKFEEPIEIEERNEIIDGVKVEYTLYIYDDESLMMKAVFKEIEKYPFILTYNGDEYDLLYLHHRAYRLGLKSPFVVSFDGYRNEIRLENTIHLDILKFFFAGSLLYVFPKGTFFSRTLDFTAEKILGKKKLDPGEFDKFTRQVADYNFVDSELVYEFTTHNDNLILNMIVLMSRAYNRPLDEVCRTSLVRLNTDMFDYVHIKANYLIPTEVDFDQINNSIIIPTGKGARYKGAIIKAKPGITFNCKSYDFASLYPSAIDNWHLSYENINCDHEECESNLIPESEYWMCKEEQGIVSCWFGALKDVRIIFKRMAKDDSYTKMEMLLYISVAQALKIVLLSGYGLFGAYGKTKYYLLPLANAITATSRHSIMIAINIAEDLVLNVVYVHTDGIIVEERDNLSLVLKERVEKQLNIDFDLDNEYRYVIVSKKANYLGIGLDGKPNITGLTGSKRHICPFFRSTFDEIIAELSKAMNPEGVLQAKESIKLLVSHKIEDLKQRKFKLEDLTFEIMLRHNPLKAGINDQNYNVARFAIKRGIQKKAGDFIHKILTVGAYSAKPVQFTRLSEVNVIKYEQLLESTLSQLFIPLDISFKEIWADKFSKLDSVLVLEFEGEEDKSLDLEFDAKKQRIGLGKWIKED